VGVNLLDTSRILSNEFMNDAESRKNLTDFIISLPLGFPVIYQLGIQPASATILYVSELYGNQWAGVL